MGKAFILSLLLAINATTLLAQPFQIGHKQQTFVDASRANRNITTEIYYPAVAAGEDVPIVPGQFPVLVFGHGFLMVWSAYAPVWNVLVPNGYIMVFPTTETGIAPSHINFGKDIAFLAGAMKAEGANAASPFFGAVANSAAVMGHSMGGGAAFLAAQFDTSITVLATLAAANTDPSAIVAATGISIPSMVVAGGNDCVTPPAQHQLPMYNALASPCKTFVSVTGASHCQFAGANAICSFGESTCSPPPAITPVAQQTTTLNLLLPWLNFYLKQDNLAGVQFQNLITAGAGISSQQNCSLASTPTIDVSAEFAPSVFSPNPFSVASTLHSRVALTNATLTVSDIYGKTLVQLREIHGHSVTLSRDKLASGLYIARLTQGDKVISVNKVVIAD